MITKKTIILAMLVAITSFEANALYIKKTTAKLQAMDKITGNVTMLEIPVNTSKTYEDFSIVIRECKTTPPEETPQSFAFVDITETNQDQEKNIYKGWMLSSSPALNPLEHPMYDLWLLECVDTNTQEAIFLTQEELKARDSIESTQQASQTTEQEAILTPEETHTPENIINIEDTKVEFNAIEEEAQKALELKEKENMLEELLEKPEQTEEQAKDKQEEIAEETQREKPQKKSQLIDFSNFNID